MELNLKKGELLAMKKLMEEARKDNIFTRKRAEDICGAYLQSIRSRLVDLKAAIPYEGGDFDIRKSHIPGIIQAIEDDLEVIETHERTEYWTQRAAKATVSAQKALIISIVLTAISVACAIYTALS